MATLQQSPPEAGWYPDPHGHGELRWWDGRHWSSHVTAKPRSGRRAGLMWLIPGMAILTILVSMTLWSGLPARLAENGLRPADPAADFPAPAEPTQPASASDLRTAISSSVLVKGNCGPGCGSIGGGIAVSETDVLTAAHVVGETGTAVVVTEAGDGMEAQIVATDPARDLALLRTGSPHRLAPVVLRPEQAVIGEGAHAVGNPDGVRRVSDGSVTDLVDLQRDGILEVQTDADIDLGNSGGPLLDDKGRLLGIVIQEHEFDDSIAWATAASEVAMFLAAALGPDALPMDAGPIPGGQEYDRMIDDMFRDLQPLPEQ